MTTHSSFKPLESRSDNALEGVMATLNPMELRGRNILVTGASSGIGRETAILLGQLEANVILAGRNRARLDKTRECMHGSNHRIEVIDLNESATIPGWIRKVSEEAGPLHGLVHNAGIHKAIPLRVISSAEVERFTRTNLSSAIMLVVGFRQKGCCVHGASIVLLSSVAAFCGQPVISVYAATKAALIGFAKSAAMELSGEGLRVNCVAPGFVESEMTAAFREKLTPDQYETIVRMHPLGIGKTRDVAYSIAFLLADTGRWITGTTLVVDGGYSAC